MLLLNDKSTEKSAIKEALYFIQQGPEWVFEECKDEKPYIRDITKQKLLALY